VEEIRFEDGTVGYATDGTPVDCVRFAALGLFGSEPELIVSGINHGANLGDDITYSGTVAAALEGAVLGVPAIAVSQQSTKREMDFRFGKTFEFDASALFAARLVAGLDAHPISPGTLLNVNVPALAMEDLAGAAVTRLGKRVYRDNLELEEEDETGRRRYRIYGMEPSYRPEEGTDFAAIDADMISVTPLHFELTDVQRLEEMAGWDLDTLLAEPAATDS
jgi:5'-nucleotidase